MPTRTRVIDESLVDAGHDTPAEEVHETRQDDYGHPDGISPGVIAQRNDFRGEVALRDPAQRHHRVPFRAAMAANADGAGALTVTFDGPREGTHWLIERIAINAAGGTTTIFVGQTDDRGFVEFAPSNVRAVADENQPIYVPENNKLFFVTAGLAAAAAYACTLQGLMVEGDY